jgi:signal transduction histidine kinase
VPGRVYNAFDLYWLPIVFVSGINLVLLVVFGLFYSHSMAGPVHNMRKNLQEMAAGGPVRPIRIRKGDQFQELVDDINRLIETRVK